MGKNMNKKLMPIALTFVLLLSAIAIVPQGLADPFVFPDGITWKATGLTCGEEVTYMVKDGSLQPETNYRLELENYTGNWMELEDGEATDDGDLYITFNAPGWHNLDPNNAIDPIGTWNLRLFNESSGTWEDGYNATISITKLYDIKVKYGSDWLDWLIYNTTYTPIYIYVYNWTGSRYVIDTDHTFDIEIHQPDGMTVLADYTGLTTGIWDLDITSEDLDFRNGAGNLEYYLGVDIYDQSYTTSTAIPVLLGVTADYPTDAEWGDTITVTGYVKDGQGNGIGGYEVALYCPINGDYYLAANAVTYSTGRYSMSVETGDDISEPFNAGTWYVGTWYSGVDPARVSESDMFEHYIDPITGFIRYHWFELASDNSAEITIESPDEIIDGFEQDINITAVWNNEPFGGDDDDAADGPAWVHITGIDAYYGGVEYDDDDVITLGQTGLTIDGDDSYYIIENIIFNETGTGTIIVTYPYNNEVLTNDEYNNTDLLANITGSLNFQVGNAAEMNMVVSDMPDEVMVIVGDEPNDCWIDDFANVTVEVFGDEEGERMNASIHVSGCGLDFTIDEDDEPEDNDNLLLKFGHDYWDDYPVYGMYHIKVSPKTAGVITITATNETDNTSITKDFSVKGLKGTVTTSEGNDKEISVQSSETITVTVTNGAYATVTVSYYDENWDIIDCEMYDVDGDGETAGEGLNGIFEFEIEEDDIEEGVGYLFVTAYAAGWWMYDIIDVAPVHDLTVEVTDPTNWSTNKAFTVGYNHEDFEFKVYGPTGDVMDDIEDFYAVVVDEDHDEDNPLQTIIFKETSGKWVPDDDFIPWFPGQLIITAVNNTGENEHDGNITFDIDYATVTYNPEGLTAGINLENITVEIAVVDANGEPMPEGTMIYLHIENDTGYMDIPDMEFSLDEGGIGEFEIKKIGDLKTWVNATLYDNDWEDGNLTAGDLMIEWPIMELDPDTIFIGQPNTVIITAMDYLGNPVEGINLTLWTGGTSFGTPDPVETDADGKVEFSIQPEASGKANVTIVRGIEYINGALNWSIDDSIITDTYLTITSMRAMKISVSKSPIYQGDTLTVTVTSNDVGLANADVEFAGTTVKTDATGKATFTAPDPGVESAIYTIMAEKTGYLGAEKSITVIKVYVISAILPSEVKAGEEFTLTIIAKGMPLAGAEVTFNGKTTMSDGDGKLKLTAPSSAGDYPLTATYEGYGDYSTTIPIAEGGGIPGFELLTLIAAIGVAFILLRRKR